MYRDFGSKPGSGGVINSHADKKERLRKLALETLDLSSDPYFMRNHIGSYECRLCLTLHNNEGNYLAHTQGKRHQMNLKRRATKLERLKEGGMSNPALLAQKPKVIQKKTIKIGRPGYNVAKMIEPSTGQKGLLFQLMYPEIDENVQPLFRFVSAFEQKVDVPFDRNYQYLLFAAEPYETIGFKIPNLPIDKGEEKFETEWDTEKRIFSMKLAFLEKSDVPLPPPPPPKEEEEE
jgi:splicing factor 3A subunit 2